MTLELGNANVAVLAPPPYERTVMPVVGIPGPAGPQGPSGAAGGSRQVVHQTTPSASWIVNHTFGAYPQVTILTESLDIMDPDVTHNSSTQINVHFAVPTAGYAVLS